MAEEVDQAARVWGGACQGERQRRRCRGKRERPIARLRSRNSVVFCRCAAGPHVDTAYARALRCLLRRGPAVASWRRMTVPATGNSPSTAAGSRSTRPSHAASCAGPVGTHVVSNARRMSLSVAAGAPSRARAVPATNSSSANSRRSWHTRDENCQNGDAECVHAALRHKRQRRQPGGDGPLTGHSHGLCAPRRRLAPPTLPQQTHPCFLGARVGGDCAQKAWPREDEQLQRLRKDVGAAL